MYTHLSPFCYHFALETMVRSHMLSARAGRFIVYRFGCELLVLEALQFLSRLVMYTHLSRTLLLPPHETMVRSHMLSARAGRNPSRGRRRRNRRRKPSCTARRTWAKRREARAAVGAVCILGARGRRRWRGSRSRCRDAPVGAPPEGNAKEVTRRRRRVTTAASRDDSVVAHGSLPAAWSDSGVTVAERWPW